MSVLSTRTNIFCKEGGSYKLKDLHSSLAWYPFQSSLCHQELRCKQESGSISHVLILRSHRSAQTGDHKFSNDSMNYAMQYSNLYIHADPNIRIASMPYHVIIFIIHPTAIRKCFFITVTIDQPGIGSKGEGLVERK